jgi:hypothetical protein
MCILARNLRLTAHQQASRYQLQALWEEAAAALAQLEADGGDPAARFASINASAGMLRLWTRCNELRRWLQVRAG